MKVNKGPERINILLLGKGGANHEGADLTDTIIFASVSSQGTVLISVPRDLWYDPWQTKINSLYLYGEEKEGNGMGKTKEILGDLLGQKIDHTFLIDFTVFKDLVDLAGGVDVVVDRTFDDYKYPIAGKENDLCNEDREFKCRYEHVHFEAGLSHLDGDMALKFVRSRYAEGEEGTDMARSVRQQKVVSALKEKFSSPSFFLSAQKVRILKEIYLMRVRSDWSRKDFIALANIFLTPSARDSQSFVINGWQEEKGLIYHPKKHSSGQWVLLPRDQSWKEIHDYVGCLVNESEKSLCSRFQTPVVPVQ